MRRAYGSMGSGFDPWILRKGACPCTGLSQLNQKQSFSTLNGTSREEPIARRRVAVPGAGSCPRHFPSAPQIRVATGVIRPLSRRQRVADHLFDPLPSTPVLSHPVPSSPIPSHTSTTIVDRRHPPSHTRHCSSSWRLNTSPTWSAISCSIRFGPRHKKQEEESSFLRPSRPTRCLG